MLYSADTIINKLKDVNEVLSIMLFSGDDKQDYYGISKAEQVEYAELLHEIKVKANNAYQNIKKWEA